MSLQLPLFETQSSWTPPDLGTLPSWKGAKRVGFDVETCDPHLKQLGIGARRGAFICGYSFAIEDGPKHYIPLRHLGGDNVDPVQGLQYLRDQAREFDGEIVGAHLAYDIDMTAEAGIEFRNVKRFRDVQIADPLICELHRSYSLQAIAERHGFPGKDVDLLNRAAREYGVDPKGGMWKLPARYVGAYAEQDTALPLQLLRRQERVIDDEDLWEVYNLESDVLPILVKMRRRGVAVDEDRLAQIEAWSLAEEEKALAQVRVATGVRISVGDVWKAGALVPVFHHLGITLPKTATGKDSIKKDILASIDHPAAHALSRARAVNKIRTTFAQSIRTYMTNGRIHATFNQLRRTDESQNDGAGEGGAAYGRLSCTDPNMQQQPARDPETGPMWRSIYRPDEGKTWASCDFSQQEPKWLIHWAVLTGELNIGTTAYQAAVAAAEDFKSNPQKDSYDAFSQFSGLKRKEAKEVYLGRVYGMGSAKMARKLSLETKFITNRQERRIEVAGDEAQAIIDRFDAGVPYGTAMAKLAESIAKQRGYVKTMSGRRCRFPTDPNGNWDFTHKALNRIIQGSSADQVKQTMIALEAAGHEIQLQVHDELDLSVRDDKQAREVAQIMIEAVPLRLPMKVDVELGPSWGESMGGYTWNLGGVNSAK